MQDNETYNGLWIAPETMTIKELSFLEMGVYSNIMNYSPNCCYESNERLAKKFHTCKRTIENVIKKLVKLGLIKVEFVNNNSAKRQISLADNTQKQPTDRGTQNLRPSNRGREQSFPQGFPQAKEKRKNCVGDTQNLRPSYRGEVRKICDQIKKKEKIKKKEPSGSAAMEEPQRPSDLTRIATMHSAPKRSDFASDSEFEDAYYAWRSTRSMPQKIHKIKSGDFAMT